MSSTFSFARLPILSITSFIRQFKVTEAHVVHLFRTAPILSITSFIRQFKVTEAHVVHLLFRMAPRSFDYEFYPTVQVTCTIVKFGILKGPWTLILSRKYHLLCTI